MVRTEIETYESDECICDGRKRQNNVLLESLKHDYRIWHFIRYQRIADIVNEMYGKSVLDVGCGIGLLDFLLVNKNVVGVDVNFENVREARRIEGTMEAKDNTIYSLVVADLHCLPFRKKFDVIISSEVLEHLKDDRRALNAMLSLLEKNGFLMVAVPNVLMIDVPPNNYV